MQRSARKLGVPALALLASLAACGPAGETETPAQPGAPAPAPPAPQATPEPEAQPLRSTPPDPEVVGVESRLPDDVPLPEGARAVHPALSASGTTRASFELSEPVGSVQSFYKTRLAETGWSLEGEKELESQVLLSARKDARELSVAMSESAGQTQLVILVVGE
jgi:hypothetical protein